MKRRNPAQELADRILAKPAMRKATDQDHKRNREQLMRDYRSTLAKAEGKV